MSDYPEQDERLVTRRDFDHANNGDAHDGKGTLNSDAEFWREIARECIRREALRAVAARRVAAHARYLMRHAEGCEEALRNEIARLRAERDASYRKQIGRRFSV